MTPVAPSTMNIASEDTDLNRSLQCAVLDGGRIAVVRVLGRGNFSNSMPFKRFAAQVNSSPILDQFIVDLQFCESMDSTFMGVLAGAAIALHQQKQVKLIIFQTSDHCKRLLKNLGLLPLVDLRTGQLSAIERCEKQLAPAEGEECSRVDQILLTLQAHKELVRIDATNEVRFQAVIEYLEKSLEEEGGKGA
jgi:anti-anti-sigma factor